jgi:insertion element IS1 protein InsB
VNREYFETHKTIRIRLKMDEMWSFYHDKTHEIWLWWAIDHESGETIAFWFGTREHEHLDKLLELLKPLNLGKVYTDGNYAYYERFSSEVLVVTKKNTQKIERNHLSLRTWSTRLVRKGIRFSKTAQMHKIGIALIIDLFKNHLNKPVIYYRAIVIAVIKQQKHSSFHGHLRKQRRFH